MCLERNERDNSMSLNAKVSQASAEQCWGMRADLPRSSSCTVDSMAVPLGAVSQHHSHLQHTNVLGDSAETTCAQSAICIHLIACYRGFLLAGVSWADSCNKPMPSATADTATYLHTDVVHNLVTCANSWLFCDM